MLIWSKGEVEDQYPVWFKLMSFLTNHCQLSYLYWWNLWYSLASAEANSFLFWKTEEVMTNLRGGWDVFKLGHKLFHLKHLHCQKEVTWHCSVFTVGFQLKISEIIINGSALDLRCWNITRNDEVGVNVTIIAIPYGRTLGPSKSWHKDEAKAETHDSHGPLDERKWCLKWDEVDRANQ